MADPNPAAQPRRDLAAALSRLESAVLTPTEWLDVASTLDTMVTAMGASDRDTVDHQATRLMNQAFGAAIRHRLGSGATPAPAVAPTKQTPILPVVGLVCAGSMLVLGQALGGGVLLAGTAAFAVFVLVIALAGTSAISRRRAARSRSIRTDLAPAPAEVRELIDSVRSVVGPPGRAG